MTKQECAVVMAYTGVAMLQGDDLWLFYAYIKELLGRPVWTHELAQAEVLDEIKTKSRADFVKICAEATD